MTSLVMKMGEKRTSTLTAELSPYQVANANPYVTFAAKKAGVTVLVYTSGKIVFQGSGAENLAKQFGYVAEANSSAKAGQNLALIGSDEVGNGSYFGGLAVVASLVTPADHDFLKKLGVADSKKLRDHHIRQIAPILEKNIPHKALLLTPSKYNQVVGDGLAHNAVSVKVALHNQAIFLLLETGAKADKIVIDAFTSSKNYAKYVKNEKNQVQQDLTLEEKAEGRYLAVAVSSIIARNLFLENLDKLSQQLGYTLPSGAGTASDKVAAQILAAYGKSGLAQVVKWHFKNTQKALTLLNQQGLTPND